MGLLLTGCVTTFPAPEPSLVEGASELRVDYITSPFATSWGLGGEGCTPRDYNRNIVDCVRTGTDGRRYKLVGASSSQGRRGYEASGTGKAFVERNGTWVEVRLDCAESAEIRQELEALMLEGQQAGRAEYTVGDPLVAKRLNIQCDASAPDASE